MVPTSEASVNTSPHIDREDDFFEHSKYKRRLSRHLSEHELLSESQKSRSLVPLRPRSDLEQPPLSLAQLAKQQSFAMHVENWRDDMPVVCEYLSLQHIAGSLKRDLNVIDVEVDEHNLFKLGGRTVRRSHLRPYKPRCIYQTSNPAINDASRKFLGDVSSITDTGYLSRQLTASVDETSLDPTLLEDSYAKDWCSLQPNDASSASGPTELMSELSVPILEHDDATLREVFEQFVEFDHPTEQCKAKL